MKEAQLVDELFMNLDEKARDLKKQGGSVLGYTCSMTPPEIAAAAGFLPYRIRGSIKEPQTKVDSCLEPLMCGLCRSSFDLALKGKYDFLDAVVTCHACNNMDSMHTFWKHYVKPKFITVLNTPHTLSAASLDFYRSELANYVRMLESFTGNRITDRSLLEIMRVYNENRDLLRQVSYLRKKKPSPISGSAMLKLTTISLSSPIQEANTLLTNYLAQIESDGDPKAEKKPRVLITGNCVDNVNLFELIESCGAQVAVSDLCSDYKVYYKDVDLTGDALQSLAKHYLGDIICSHVYFDDTAHRFGNIKALADQFQIDGIILYYLRFCDSLAIDIPDLTDYLRQNRIPVLELEDDYSLAALGQLKTRIQAFVELLNTH